MGHGMGNLYYGAGRFSVPFDDRVLAHIQLVMIAKLRRHEGFVLSWSEPDPGGGRSMLWISPTTELHFKFHGGKAPRINRQWLEQLAGLANTAGGLHVTDEGDLEPLDQHG